MSLGNKNILKNKFLKKINLLSRRTPPKAKRIQKKTFCYINNQKSKIGKMY